MANICETTIQFRGDEEKLRDLFSKLKPMSLGKLAECFNITANDIPDESSPFRGDIVDIDEHSYRIYQDDAWSPNIGVWHAILRKHYAYSDISFVYKAEEPGCSVYINTDDTGMFFPERYVCDYNIGDELGVLYFEKESDVLEWFNTLTKIDVANQRVTNINDIIPAFDDKFDDDEMYLTIGHFRPAC